MDFYCFLQLRIFYIQKSSVYSAVQAGVKVILLKHGICYFTKLDYVLFFIFKLLSPDSNNDVMITKTVIDRTAQKQGNILNNYLL